MLQMRPPLPRGLFGRNDLMTAGISEITPKPDMLRTCPKSTLLTRSGPNQHPKHVFMSASILCEGERLLAKGEHLRAEVRRRGRRDCRRARGRNGTTRGCRLHAGRRRRSSHAKAGATAAPDGCARSDARAPRTRAQSREGLVPIVIPTDLSADLAGRE